MVMKTLTLPLRVSEPTERHEGPIMVYDAADNDIASFHHNEESTVGQMYEEALLVANILVLNTSSVESRLNALQPV